jgi:p-hydroxybenzoate 3-monooxygenase
MVRHARTKVGIVGAGPAGLLLSHLLRLEGIASVIIEAKSKDYLENRIRAGVLEQGTTDILRDAGLGGRLDRQGLVHGGIELLFSGARHRIDLTELTAGKHVTVYGQHEVVRDLIAAHEAAEAPILFEAEQVAIHDIDTGAPRVTYHHGGQDHELTCDIIAGCDGFHGICRPSVPPGNLTIYDRQYPFAWLGILVEAAPATDELIYANHPDGFALFSMRSPEITRLYVQCEPGDHAQNWSDDRIWATLHKRLEASGDWTLTEGPILQKSITGMRSFVAEPMRHGRLFLAGDAAHIVPPTGAKGMNLAVADIRVLARALSAWYGSGNEEPLNRYSETCLGRIWKVQRFSWWMTSILHRFSGHDAFDARVQVAELDYVVNSRAAAAALAENYVGLPLS